MPLLFGAYVFSQLVEIGWFGIWIAGKLQSGQSNMSCIKGEKNHDHVTFNVHAFIALG